MADFTQTSLALYPNPSPVDFNPIAGVDLPAGTPVAQSVNEDLPGVVGKAKADSTDTCFALGFTLFPGTADKRVRTRFLGPLTLTAEAWAAVSADGDDSDGLETGAAYYLDATTAGKITKTPPASFTVQLGVALGPDTQMIGIGSAQNLSP